MQFIRGAAGLKVKEVPAYVSKYANEHWQPAVVERRLTTWLNGYKKAVREGAWLGGRGREGEGRGAGEQQEGREAARRARVSCSAPYLAGSGRRCGPGACMLPARGALHPSARPAPQYIDTGSAKPLFDVCTYGFVGSYIFSWPREYAHVKAEQVRSSTLQYHTVPCSTAGWLPGHSTWGREPGLLNRRSAACASGKARGREGGSLARGSGGGVVCTAGVWEHGGSMAGWAAWRLPHPLPAHAVRCAGG